MKILNDIILLRDSQFIIATHSQITLGYPNSTIFSFENGQINEVDYEMTDHYQITKYFLQSSEKLLQEILGD